jgi:hypothetical protein
MNRPVFITFHIFVLLAVTGCISSCSPAEGGPAMRISENGRYFIDEKGDPVFWQGDTEWELFHLFSAEDAGALLRERSKQGFNVMQVMVTGVYPEWGAMKGMNALRDMEAWLNNDPLKPNDAYFKRADAIVAAAEECGVTLVIGVYHAQDADEGRIGPNNVREWSAWLARRYRSAKNIVWSMYPHAVPASEPVIRAAVRGIREGDGGAHFVTMHPDPSPASSSFMHAEPWLSFNTLQTWSTGFINHDMVRADYGRTPVKPVVDGEARYEAEDGTTPLEARRAGYWACLAGGFYSYGHRDNWMSPRTWRSWVGAPGAMQMKVMGGLFRSIPWWRLVPDPSALIKSAEGSAAARSADGDWMLAYLTGGAAATVNLNRITASAKAEAWWVDPLTGARTRIGTFGTSGTDQFSPPQGWQDAVLYIEKESM